MKKSIQILILLLMVFSCEKKLPEQNPIILVHKNYFSVKENNLKLDSIEKIPLPPDREILKEHVDKRYNMSYHIGAIHFLILDNKNSYYLINYLEPKVLMCGNVDSMSVKDSINNVDDKISLLKNIKSIKTEEIISILNNYKKEIYNDGRIPLQITFALKKDTLNGNEMFNIITFMEKNKLQSYSMRRMNIHEIKLTNK